ncbi:MAG: hypothetical protein Q9220_003998 [cf. Caloplaca sp. 1 TL-2023]
MSSSSSGASPSILELLPHFQSSLQSFASSPSTFLVLHSLPQSPPPSHSSPLQTLHILDSSFNPPTRAHLRIALSALHASSPTPHRLLLLLATQNADKAPKPAAFEQRLAMMTILAQDILDQYSTASAAQNSESSNDTNKADLAVDIGVTKKPYYHEKSAAIEESRQYADARTGSQPQHVHLLGYDSLIRLLDTKYYPPSHSLAPLEAFFRDHRVRVTRRVEEDSKWGTREEQDAYRAALAEGRREEQGGKKEWAEKIEMVEGEGEAISSTRVREYAGKGDWEEVDRLVGSGVREWIQREKLFIVSD